MRGSRGSDSRRYFDWIYHANRDFLAARLLSDDERLYPVAAFHCQQCIEKALKGYLLYIKRSLFDGHNLTWLCKQAAGCDPDFRPFVKKSTALGRYYIETRYPADLPHDIDVDEIIRILGYTEEILGLVGEKIREDFLEEESSELSK